MTLITRKAYGGSYIAMCSKHLGADFVYAWPNAEIAVMGAGGAANIIHAREIKNAEDPKAKRKEKIAEYEDLFANPYIAAARGYVDDVILPKDTRKILIRSLDAIKNKRETRPAKKHGNIPM
jgi:acetyl-CoA carboxylase carboxyltransferase component